MDSTQQGLTVAEFRRNLAANPRCRNGTCPMGRSHIFRMEDETAFKVFRGIKFQPAGQTDVDSFRKELCSCAVFSNSGGADHELGEVRSHGRVYKACPFFREDDPLARRFDEDMSALALASLKPGEREKFLSRHPDEEPPRPAVQNR